MESASLPRRIASAMSSTSTSSRTSKRAQYNHSKTETMITGSILEESMDTGLVSPFLGGILGARSMDSISLSSPVHSPHAQQQQQPQSFASDFSPLQQSAPASSSPKLRILPNLFLARANDDDDAASLDNDEEDVEEDVGKPRFAKKSNVLEETVFQESSSGRRTTTTSGRSSRHSRYARPSFTSRQLRASISTMIPNGIRNANANATMERLAFTPTSDEMIRLDTVINSDKGRSELIQGLIPIPGDWVVKIRFCHAVEQYDAQSADTPEDRERKLHRGNAICDMFLREGSTFRLNNISDARRLFILEGGRLDHLVEAKREVLADLCTSPDLMKLVDDIEGMDGV